MLLWLASIAGAETVPEGTERVVLSETEQQWVRSHPEVHWGVDPDWPPFSFFDQQGNLHGIDADIVNLVARRAGLKLKLVRTATWSETLQNAAAGRIDFVGGIAHTTERERLLGLQFTETFCDFPTAIVTRKEVPFLTTMREFSNRKVTLPRDYATTAEYLRHFPRAQILLTDDEEQCMLKVARGEADATAINLASACYIVHLRGLTNLKISGFTHRDFFLSLAVRAGAPELLSILSKALATITPQEKEAIYAAYIHAETRQEINWRTWRERTLLAVLVGAVALLAVLAWNRGLAREIQRRKATEVALVEARDQVTLHARELGRRAKELEMLNAQLTLANRDLESFSYSVSHDLKAPLRHVQSFAQLMKVRFAAGLDPRARDYLHSIEKESDKMAELIEALLAFARVGKAPMNIGRVELEQVTRQLVQELRIETAGREVQWNIHPMPEVQGDRRLIVQVLTNLLSNALKFTRGRAPAQIEVGALPQAGWEEVVCFVRDNGVGFPQDQAEQLFDAFHRLHSQEEFEGTGIGLANVKRIIQRHGGRVWAESEPGKGATFFFSLHAATPQQARAA